MNELTEMELGKLVGGTLTASGAVGSAATGGISGGIAAAGSAVTIGALGVPILCGAIIGFTMYLVRDAIDEGFEAYKAYQLAN